MRIAFDIDDTLWKIRQDHRDQVPDYDLIQVLRWFHSNGDEVYVWSAGGIDHAQAIVKRLGLEPYITAVIEKKIYMNALPEEKRMDIAFDDMDTGLAKVDVKVKRTTIYKDDICLN